MNIFGYSVAILIIILGLYLVFSKRFDSLPRESFLGVKEMRTILGIVIAGYGLFRAVIIYQKRSESGAEDEE